MALKRASSRRTAKDGEALRKVELRDLFAADPEVSRAPRVPATIALTMLMNMDVLPITWLIVLRAIPRVYVAISPA
jgi:hypothetical protein